MHACDFLEKEQKRAKCLKIWAKMYKIWKYFEKGQSRVCAYRMYETARICPGFVFSQTRNLVFSSFFQVQIHKFDLVFIGILWTDFTTIYLPFTIWLFIFYRYWNSFSVSKSFFIRTSKILMRRNVLFWRFSASKCSCYVVFHEVLPVNGETKYWLS